MLAWVVPEANHAFRMASTESRSTLPASPQELSLGELGRMLDGTSDASYLLQSPSARRRVAWTYHQRWAIAVAPIALTLFSLSTARRGLRTRWRIGLTGAGAIWGYYLLLMGPRWISLDLAWSPLAATWLANATFVLLALTVAAGSRAAPARG